MPTTPAVTDDLLQVGHCFQSQLGWTLVSPCLYLLTKDDNQSNDAIPCLQFPITHAQKLTDGIQALYDLSPPYTVITCTLHCLLSFTHIGL